MTMFDGKIRSKWWFAIVMSQIARGYSQSSVQSINKLTDLLDLPKGLKVSKQQKKTLLHDSPKAEIDPSEPLIPMESSKDSISSPQQAAASRHRDTKVEWIEKGGHFTKEKSGWKSGTQQINWHVVDYSKKLINKTKHVASQKWCPMNWLSFNRIIYMCINSPWPFGTASFTQ